MTLGSLIFFGGIAVLLIVVVVWARRRAARFRAESTDRELNALALVRAGKDPTHEKGAESEFVGGLSARIPPRGGVEMAEVVDIDELLRGEPAAVASPTRSRLEELTNIHTGLNTLALRVPPPVAAASRAQPASQPAVVAVADLSPTEKAIGEIVANARAHAPHHVAADQPPINGAANANEAGASMPSPARALLRSADAVAGVVPTAKTAAEINVDVPLRELSLAWFEARGYRGAPASPAVRPIELVLRHKDDPARAYAFVVEPQPVDSSRVTALLRQAREIGLLRVLIVADAGAEQTAAAGKKGARVMDRRAMDEEFRKLDLGVAAKIIAVARKRAASRAAL